MFVRKICKIVLCICAGSVCLYAGSTADSSMIEKDPVFADFCFYKDTSIFIPEDSALILSYYEMENELSFTIDFESTSYSTIFGVKLPNLDMNKIITNPIQGLQGGGPCFTPASNGKTYRGCTTPNKIKVIPYEFIEFFFSSKDSLYIKSLFNSRTLLTWSYLLNMGMQKQEIKGDNVIYISGFCTGEQLKKIQERKKGK